MYPGGRDGWGRRYAVGLLVVNKEVTRFFSLLQDLAAPPEGRPNQHRDDHHVEHHHDLQEEEGDVWSSAGVAWQRRFRLRKTNVIVKWDGT